MSLLYCCAPGHLEPLNSQKTQPLEKNKHKHKHKTKPTRSRYYLQLIRRMPLPTALYVLAMRAAGYKADAQRAAIE